MLSMEELRDLIGRKVVGRDGGALGEVDDLYADRDDGHPNFATVRSAAGQSYLVPLDGARMNGDVLTVGYDLATVTAAPVMPSGGELSEEEESGLYKHYGMRSPSATALADDTEAELGHPVGMAGWENPAIATDHPAGMAGTAGAPSWPAHHDAGMAGNEPYPSDHPLGMAGRSVVAPYRLRRWQADRIGTEGRAVGTGTTGTTSTTRTTGGTTTTRRDSDRL